MKLMLDRISILVARAALIGLPAMGAAQAAPPQTAPANSDIVVQGTASHAMDTYVRQMTAPGDRGQLARWNRAVCIRVINLDPPMAKAIESRIADIGRQAGVEIASKPCKANILVIATTEPDGAVKQVRDNYPTLFRFRDNGDRPDADYQDLLKPLPVRWINGTETLGADGAPMSSNSAAALGFAVDGVPVNDVQTPTSIDSSTREDIVLSIAIIDANKLQGISTAQLADYLAMVVLGHPRFGAPFKGATIMAMFADRDAGTAIPDALTSMDRSLLKNLYSTVNLRSAERQRASIEYRMHHPTPSSKPQIAPPDQAAGH
jgi:hypothetical protein